MRNGEASCAFKSESNVPTFGGKGSFEHELSIPAFRVSYPDPVFSNDSGFGSYEKKNVQRVL